MQAGPMRHRIQIQDYTVNRDSANDDVRSYFVFAMAWAEINTTGGRELFAAQQQFAEATALIRMRYIPGVSERMRVYHAAESTYYDILSVRPDDKSRRETLTLICRTGISDEA